jgi:serine/threonine protein kinase
VLKGGNLLEFLMRRKVKLSLEETRELMRGVLQGLAELEKMDMVHRDIKLENLMLREKDSLSPVIVDFGLAVSA